METKKNSFVLYHDIREPLADFSDEDLGKIFRAVMDYSEFGTVPDFTGALKVAFSFIRKGIDRDTQAWERKREQRREAGSLGGRQRAANAAKQKQANQANATNFKQSQANQAVPVNVPVPVPVPVNVPVPVPVNVPVPVPVNVPVPVPVKKEETDKLSLSAREKSAQRERREFVPPSLDEVREYARQRASPVDPDRFFEYFSAGNWIDSRGNPVKNWKQKFITWETKSESPPETAAKRLPGDGAGNELLKLIKEGAFEE